MDENQDTQSEASGRAEIHMPAPTYWPFVLGGGVTLVCFGFVTSIWFCIVGGILFVGGLLGWIKDLLDG
ncbi:MAG TPA: cytochrome c oxidase subunit 4 [Thermomicrobiaceae bacterium]|nr:cytochrome c oxidase subunit 4 [Thermomicrobiaceae bacterium]